MRTCTARAYCQSLLVVSRVAATTVPAVSVAAAMTNRRKSPKCTRTIFDSRATAQNRSRIATRRAENQDRSRLRVVSISHCYDEQTQKPKMHENHFDSRATAQNRSRIATRRAENQDRSR